MNKLFYSFPNQQSFAFVSRTGTSAILLAAVQHFGINDGLPLLCSDNLPTQCCVVVRNPIERFRSNLWVMRTSAADAIEKLQYLAAYEPNKRSWLQHFRPVSTIVQSDSRLFKFFDPEIWTALKLPPYSELVSNSQHHPELTPEQEDKVRKIYADDIALWESLQ